MYSTSVHQFWALQRMLLITIRGSTSQLNWNCSGHTLYMMVCDTMNEWFDCVTVVWCHQWPEWWGNCSRQCHFHMNNLAGPHSIWPRNYSHNPRSHYSHSEIEHYLSNSHMLWLTALQWFCSAWRKTQLTCVNTELNSLLCNLKIESILDETVSLSFFPKNGLNFDVDQEYSQSKCSETIRDHQMSSVLVASSDTEWANDNTKWIWAMCDFAEICSVWLYHHKMSVDFDE